MKTLTSIIRTTSQYEIERVFGGGETRTRTRWSVVKLLACGRKRIMNERKSSAVRYGVAALLFLVLCVAGTLSGYRFGFLGGYAAGAKKRKSEIIVAQVYPVSDLVLAKEGV